jgi:hypothetical protein
MLTKINKQNAHSEEVTRNIISRIDLMQGWIISASLIHLPYSINGKEQEPITYTDSESIAAFGLSNHLIDCYDVIDGKAIMYKWEVGGIKEDSFGWCMQVVEERIVSEFPNNISSQDARRFVANWYYDNGDCNEVKGRVIKMIPYQSSSKKRA